MSEHLWFLDTLVTVRAAHGEGSDGISLLESVAREGDSPPLHVHETEDEVFHVLEGELALRVGNEDLHVGAGRTAVAPKGVPHTYRVQSEEARWLVVTSHGDFERMVRSLSRPAASAELPEPAGPPTPAQLDALAAACRASRIELVGPPLS
jgi:quercetin dioxygenase-like cupin family protein